MIATTEKHRVPTSGGDLSYVGAGDPGAPVLLLLHGFPMSSFEWRDLIPLFASRFRVIAPDLLGCGDSGGGGGAPLHVGAQAGYVRELLGALGVTGFAVVGHGIGGGIAQQLTIEGAGVEAMVLIGSSAASGASSAVLATIEAGEIEGKNAPRELISAVFDAGMRHRSRLSDAVLAEYVRPFAGRGVASALAGLHAEEESPDGPWEELGRIEFPVLILWGEEDPFEPVSRAEKLNEAIPSSALGLLPGCGHFLVDEAGETIGPMIHEYLRALYLRAPHGHEAGPVPVQLGTRPPEPLG